MLLLVTILLVLVAAVTLLIGIFSDNLALIFISIGASALAAIVLGVLSQMSKRKSREATAAAGPEPLPAREPATVGGGRADAEQAAADIATLGEPVGGATAAAASEAPTTTMSAVGGPLPIADYDSLRVNEILPALDDLDLDQLEAVAQHEENNKNRTTVLNRIDDLMDELEAQEAGGTPPVVDLTDDDDVAEAAVEAIETVGEPVVTSSAAAAPAAGGFPIPNYDDLDEDELIELFEDLDADQLEAVADREEAGQNRDAVLDAIDDRLDILEGIVPAPTKAASAPAKAAVASKAPAKKAPAKKAPVKATTKRATPPTATRKAAAPAPVKRAPAKAAAKKATAPAKKTAAKAAASKAPARSAAKAPAKKAAARTAKTTKKAATTAKKAAPVKKATAAKKATKR